MRILTVEVLKHEKKLNMKTNGEPLFVIFVDFISSKNHETSDLENMLVLQVYSINIPLPIMLK